MPEMKQAAGQPGEAAQPAMIQPKVPAAPPGEGIASGESTSAPEEEAPAEEGGEGEDEELAPEDDPEHPDNLPDYVPEGDEDQFLFGETNWPDEPPDPLPMPVEDADEWLPWLAEAANDPNAPESLRDLYKALARWVGPIE
jgi:hypothetical protein